jgi:hypothetical protein
MAWYGIPGGSMCETDRAVMFFRAVMVKDLDDNKWSSYLYNAGRKSAW